jgi:hypothetical protein
MHNIEDVLLAIKAEREYQKKKWGEEFDSKNTPNDWIAYVTHYVSKAATKPLSDAKFASNLLKAATLCVAALQRTNYAKRHFD